MQHFPTAISGLSDIVEQFDLYLFDQWGVIHNGQILYPHVIETLERLRQCPNKTLLILSNSSRGPDYSKKLMNNMGLNTEIFDHIITSGGHFLECLRTRPAGFYQDLGYHYYGIHWPEGYALPDDLTQYQRIENITEADFILLTGLDKTPKEYQPVLDVALKHRTPMICANPDLLSPEGGEIKACPGQLAEIYQDMGGQVIRHGKPAKELYEIILQQYPHDPARTLAVGDSLHHDIQGANIAGISGWFFHQGIHHPEWKALCENFPEEQAAKTLADQFGVNIHYFSQGLQW